ncbi:MAG: alpha/beta fold hydrolase BchO [Roseobacter sp.]
MRWPPPKNWPHVDHSRQIYSAPHRWHVQEMGEGNTLLLLHGAGGSTHSFRDLMPLLAQKYHVVALDLPGQGFTQLGARHRCGLAATAEDIAALCRAEGWMPAGYVGHSAGCAVALSLAQMDLSPRGQVPRVVGINAALENFDGLAGALFPALAKVLAAMPFTAQVFSASSAKPARIQALISSTGSDIGPEGVALYRTLVQQRDHVDAALLMMAQWSLDDLNKQLPQITARTLFLTGDGDKTVPPRVSEKAAAEMPNAQTMMLTGAGHLAHEEYPEKVSSLILDWMASNPSDG